MSDTYKFVIDGSTLTGFEQQADGSFEQDDLKLNQALSFDAATGDVTLTSTFDQYIRVEVFHQTADTADDAALYSKPIPSFTALDGTPIVQGSGGGGHHGGLDDVIPEWHQHGGKSDLDGDKSDDDTVVFTGADDHSHGGFGDDNLHGGSGNDTLGGDAGDDTLSGDLGDDHLAGGAGFDVIHGGGGNDVASGGDDGDVLTGDDGNDTLAGGNGNDDVSGDTGNDTVSGGAGDDHASGGSGDDTVKGNAGDDTLNGDDGSDKVSGGDGADHVSGGSGNDKVIGELGDDMLSGDAGNDKLNGGAGDDTVSGGSGKDMLTGGLGADHFVFADGDFAGFGSKTADRVGDFSHAQGDMIDMSGVDADTATAGDQAFTFVGTDAFSHTAGELHVAVAHSAMFLSGDTNGDGIADFAIRIDAATPLVLEDLVL
ncbi:MAG: calcium-binding protein [Novosphingobium sp.]